MILRVRTSSYIFYVHAKYTVFEKLDGSNISLEIIVNDFSCILLQRSKKYHDHLQLILIHHYADAVSDMFLISSVISKALGLRSKIKTIQLIHFEIFLHISKYKLQLIDKSQFDKKCNNVYTIFEKIKCLSFHCTDNAKLRACSADGTTLESIHVEIGISYTS